MDRDLEEKAGLLLKAQRAYIDTIKYGNPRWASAAGFQVGVTLRRALRRLRRRARPRKLDKEEREVYVEELHKKIRILLEKSLRWHRENLLMVERLGVDTDWAEKTKLSYNKLVQLLDPAERARFEQSGRTAGYRSTGPAGPGSGSAAASRERPPDPRRPTQRALGGRSAARRRPGRSCDRCLPRVTICPVGSPAATQWRSSGRARYLLDTSPVANYTFAPPANRVTLPGR